MQQRPTEVTPVEAGRPVSISDRIAAELRDQILRGRYQAGDRLPSERELASRLEANRSSVREALKKLEQLGMISIRRGGGARVLPLEEAGLGVVPHLLAAHVPDRELVAQWLDVWELVLAGAARLAVERGSDEDFAAGYELIERLISARLSAEDFIATTDALTQLVAIASRNVILQMAGEGTA